MNFILLIYVIKAYSSYVHVVWLVLFKIWVQHFYLTDFFMSFKLFIYFISQGNFHDSDQTTSDVSGQRPVVFAVHRLRVPLPRQDPGEPGYRQRAPTLRLYKYSGMRNWILDPPSPYKTIKMYTYRFFLCLSNYFTLFLAATKVTLDWAKIFAHLRFRVLLHDGTVEWMYPVLESISDKLQHPIPKIFYWEIAFTTTVETNRKIYLILTETNTLKSYVCVFILITCKKYIYVSLRIKVITQRAYRKKY